MGLNKTTLIDLATCCHEGTFIQGSVALSFSNNTTRTSHHRILLKAAIKRYAIALFDDTRTKLIGEIVFEFNTCNLVKLLSRISRPELYISPYVFMLFLKNVKEVLAFKFLKRMLGVRRQTSSKAGCIR